jgi:tetratricopeptide (TPR) repeat protein
MSFFTANVKHNPTSPMGYNNRACEEYKEGNVDAALKDINQAIALRDNYRAAYYNRAMIYYLRKDYQKAITDLTKEISLNPNPVKSYYLRGVIYSTMGMYQNAINDFQKYLFKKQNDANAYYDAGVAYRSLNQFILARKYFELAIKYNPTYVDAYNNLAYIAFLNKDFDEAIKNCNKILELKPNDENALAMIREYQSSLLKN